MPADDALRPRVISELSLVVPVYQGEHTLATLVAEVAPLTVPQKTQKGRAFRVTELVLVHDGARDASAQVMKELALTFPFVRPIWLSRNFGQHAATLAGLASTVSEWVVTLDEDGQQLPEDVGRMLDRALDESARLVYAQPTNPPSHGALRNAFSSLAKSSFATLLGANVGRFDSFRLIEGEIARSVAAYSGPNVFLDVALSWVVNFAARCPVELRQERGQRSGYTPRKLLRHFWQLVLSSGTLPLRLIALVGGASIVFAILFSALQVWNRLHDEIPVQGWTSTMIVLCLFGGLILVSIGIIAEYLGFSVSMAMGKPAYLIVSRPREDIAENS
ncbi:MAG TPA: glycosyltransferase [Polyangiaceae bacterium]|nr:glycosyltransferase [Polyangiaceae bacterium]